MRNTLDRTHLNATVILSIASKSQVMLSICHTQHNAKSQPKIATEPYKKGCSSQHGLSSIPYLLATMSSTHLTPMDSDEAYLALLGLIMADEPSSQDGMTWDRIAHLAHVGFAEPEAYQLPSRCSFESASGPTHGHTVSNDHAEVHRYGYFDRWVFSRLCCCDRCSAAAGGGFKSAAGNGVLRGC